MKCETCQYCQQSSYEMKGKQVNMAYCTLSNPAVKVDKEHMSTIQEEMHKIFAIMEDAVDEAISNGIGMEEVVKNCVDKNNTRWFHYKPSKIEKINLSEKK